MKFNRIFMIVTDSLGIGPDKKQKSFGDQGANTLLHVSETGLLEIPTWKKLGITSIARIMNPGKIKNQIAYTAKINELSNGKDTLTGHWEMMGVYTEHPFPTFTETGFPGDLIKELEKAFNGRKIVGNKSASGTDIINELADKEINENSIIVYTSADSVLQICGHEKYMGLDNLYRYAEKAREICSSKPEWNVGRIIARPYIGKPGNYTRTFNRHDYSVVPPHDTILNELQNKGIKVISVGKINDIFSGIGIDQHYPSEGDADGMDITIDLALENTSKEFIFTNLVQFDSHYGHRRDVEGYATNINLFDIKLAKLINALKEDDLLIITSDHGNDPTFPGYNHTREALPATIFSKSFKNPRKLNDFNGLGTLGNIIARNFDIDLVKTGDDIFDELV
ncbi:MAG: phosphopentomutase [Mycoplasma sp.]|nr:phosphopentomutase [Mycoplasma sp.]